MLNVTHFAAFALVTGGLGLNTWMSSSSNQAVADSNRKYNVDAILDYKKRIPNYEGKTDEKSKNALAYIKGKLEEELVYEQKWIAWNDMNMFQKAWGSNADPPDWA